MMCTFGSMGTMSCEEDHKSMWECLEWSGPRVDDNLSFAGTTKHDEMHHIMAFDLVIRLYEEFQGL